MIVLTRDCLLKVKFDELLISQTFFLVIIRFKKGGKMGGHTHRLNIDFPADEYTYLKMLCAEKGISIKGFVVPLILKAIEDEEDTLLEKKAEKRLKKMNADDLILIEDAFKEAGWDVKDG